MKLAHINSLRDMKARARSGYLELAANVSDDLTVISMDILNTVDLISLRYDPYPKTIYDFLRAGSFAGLFDGGEPISDCDMFVVDTPHNAVFDGKEVSSIMEAQLLTAAFLLASKRVSAEKIVIVTDQPIDLAKEIESYPATSWLAKMIKASTRDGKSHPVETLSQVRVVVAPARASEIVEALVGKKVEPSLLVTVPVEQAAKVEVVAPAPEIKFIPSGLMAEKYSDPDKPYMKIVHINTLATAPCWRNVGLKHAFGDNNIVEIESPGDKVSLGLHDVVIVDYPKYIASGETGVKQLQDIEQVQLAFVVKFLQMGLPPERLAVVTWGADDFINKAFDNFVVFKEMFKKPALTAPHSDADMSAIVPLDTADDPEILALHAKLQQVHRLDGQIDVFPEKVEEAFAGQLNFPPKFKALSAPTYDAGTAPGGEGGNNKLQAKLNGWAL